MAFLVAALDGVKPSIPVMLDTDGLRPEELPGLLPHLALVQVTVEFTGSEAALDEAIASVKAAAAGQVPHALVLVPREDTSDSTILRLVEEAHAASAAVQMRDARRPARTRGARPPLGHAAGAGDGGAPRCPARDARATAHRAALTP